MSAPAQPRRLFRVLAVAEVVTWTLLLLGMLGKYVLNLGDWGVRIGGGLHGFVFLSYCAVVVLIGVDQRWPLRQILLGLGSAVIPYLTVPFERHAERTGLLGEGWRLLHDRPKGPHEAVVATTLRRPVLAGATALVAIALVFTGLLAAGPPTEWFS